MNTPAPNSFNNLALIIKLGDITCVNKISNLWNLNRLKLWLIQDHSAYK